MSILSETLAEALEWMNPETVSVKIDHPAAQKKTATKARALERVQRGVDFLCIAGDLQVALPLVMDGRGGVNGFHVFRALPKV